MYNGLRRRIGNIQGNLNIIGANHGQIPGFLVYKLFTRKQIESGVNVEKADGDFTLPINICKRFDKMLKIMQNPNDIKQVIVEDIIDYLVNLHSQTEFIEEYKKDSDQDSVVSYTSTYSE